MPIYEYACPDCGYHGEHMQKFSDAPIAQCPGCSSANYARRVSAAAFALKGTGWYVTDFKGNGTPKAKTDSDGKKQDGSATSESTPTGATSETSSATCGAGACPACAD
ncbi:MAG: zinc ribbon domain-containing protein [Casimicrobiaceae bacterium]|nr:zinc ribbon domain-containing protein [Casimicrobiaceae bacterium]MDW8312385.1 zinc ribbon domain-containing protein [Burkholderiales bacterium]